MKVGEAIKLLKKNGFEEANQVGSHKKFKKGDKMIIIVYHAKDSEELSKSKVKELKNIIK